MSLFKKKIKDKIAEESPVQDEKPNSPLMIIRLVDGIHLEMAIEWPDGCDIQPFARLLALLNSGNLIAQQLAAASSYASFTNQPEQAIAITNALDSVRVAKKTKTSLSDDEPLILPSKFMHNLLKSHGH